MAQFQLPTPDPMKCKGNTEENWKFFKEAFNDYSTAMELEKKAAKVQAATLKSLLGAECKRMLTNLKLTDAKMEDVKEIIQALDNKFIVHHNVLYERFQFYTAKQLQHETIDEYLDKLRHLALTCKFSEEDNMIRDILVLHCRDQAATARLFRRQEEPTLKVVTDELRISEATKKQMKTMTTDSNQQVHLTKSSRSKDNRFRSTTSHRPTSRTPRQQRTQQQVNKCVYCGTLHRAGKSSCPAYGRTCTKCKKRHHFASVCLQKEVRKVDREYASDDSSPEYEEVKKVTVEVNKLEKSIKATLLVEKQKEVQFEIDTGASCNIINKQHLQNIDYSLQKTNTILKMYDGSVVHPIGKTKLKMLNPKTQKKYRVEFEVVQPDKYVPILGRSASEAMNFIEVNYANIARVQNPMTEEQPLTVQQLKAEFPEVLQGTGKLPGQYHMDVDETVKPVIHAARRVPVAIKEQLKKELDELETQGIIAKQSEPTDWVSSMVVTKKSNGRLRICIDPKDLNKALKRSHYPTRTIEELIPDLHNAKIFSVLDAKNAFWHVELDDYSSKLTCFNSPFGRYIWRRLPYGLSSSPEEYARRQDNALEGLKGVKTIADDMLVFGVGDTVQDAIIDHNENLRKLMQRCQDIGLKINKEKVKLGLTEVPFIGHVISKDGLKPDPDKIRAIAEMPLPTDKKGIQRLMGFVNYLSKFLPNLSDLCQPLRKLTVENVVFEWTDEQTKAVDQIKKAVTNHPVLAYFDNSKEVTLQVDASETGLGAVLMQEGQPIAYASRALKDQETRYAQIEKELLAASYGLERFHHYTFGRKVMIQSDHKPLEIIQRKAMQSAPKRLQRMLVDMAAYDYEIYYVPGTKMYLADTLSRAYLPSESTPFTALQQELAEINMLSHVDIEDDLVNIVKTATLEDKDMQCLRKLILTGWPEDKQRVPQQLRVYWHFREELATEENLIYKGERLIIPPSARKRMIEEIHTSHQGIQASTKRAREYMYWPSMTTHIKDYIEKCDTCRVYSDQQQKETLQSHDVPNRPWAKIAMDIFHLEDRDYLITVDYFSNYWEIDYLPDLKSETVIYKTKAQFARHGIPDCVMSDNGPQFSSDQFAEFARKWKFEHSTSSPGYPQSNGKAENAVKTAKRLLKKAKADNKDPYLAMLDLRNTPGNDGASPVQKLMSRRTKTCLPATHKLLKPKVETGVKENIQIQKQKQADYYNKTAKDIKPLNLGDSVVIYDFKEKLWSTEGIIVKKLPFRSYVVKLPSGRNLRRNRRYLKRTSNELFALFNNADDETATPVNHPVQPATSQRGSTADVLPPVTTRAGRAVRPPKYLQDYHQGDV